MKIIEAISGIDELKRNTYSQLRKVQWLSELDATVQAECVDTHDGGGTFQGYGGDTDLQTVLLIPAPYDNAYLLWLEAKIDYYNGEMDKYNNAMAMFYAAYDGFKNHYNRTHMPKGQKIKYF